MSRTHSARPNLDPYDVGDDGCSEWVWNMPRFRTGKRRSKRIKSGLTSAVLDRWEWR